MPAKILSSLCFNNAALGQFKQFASEERVDPDRCIGVNQNDADTIAESGHLFRCDPGFLKHIWTRRQFGQNLYSVSGLVHASSTDSIMDTVGQYLTAPTQSWDALICPFELYDLIRTLNWLTKLGICRYHP